MLGNRFNFHSINKLTSSRYRYMFYSRDISLPFVQKNLTFELIRIFISLIKNTMVKLYLYTQSTPNKVRLTLTLKKVIDFSRRSDTMYIFKWS